MAENDRFSDSLANETISECSPAIQAALKELTRAVAPRDVHLKAWNKNYVAAVVTLNIDLPTRGPVNGVDIRPAEPVILLFHRQNYPYAAPSARSDRIDFPASRLPHLNPTRKGAAVEFCLHRGNIHDWFAEHSLADYVDRVRGWLRDAASKRLIREEDRFEPTRIGDLAGLCVFEPHMLSDYISDRWSANDMADASVLYSTMLHDFADDPTLDIGFSMEVHDAMGFETAAKLSEKVRRLYAALVDDAPRLDRPAYSLLVWSRRRTFEEYVASMPETYGELNGFAESFGMDLKAAVSRFCAEGLKIIVGIPVVLTILRPQNLIGSDSPFEFLPFVISGAQEYQDEQGNLSDSARVWPLSHRRPLTTAFARELSLTPDTLAEKTITLLGCGAEGSKIGLHLGRSGLRKIQFVDTDSLSPHNLVRHGLLPEDLGKNKATAVKDELERMFHSDSSKEYTSVEKSVLEAIAPDLRVDLVIDATASSSVLETLIHAEMHESRLVRCEMADGGAVGYFLAEGARRLPRIDDLQVQLYDLGLDYPVVTDWLIRHREARSQDRGRALENIGIGMSCSSDTMRLPDDIVSYHSSLFAIAARSILNGATGTGRIQVNSLYSNGGVQGSVVTVGIEAPVVLPSQSDPGWSVRVAATAHADLSRFLSKHKICETGGLLVGMVHKKRRIIYVTRVLPPSRDSRGSPYAFRRGIKDYPEMLDNIHVRTGNLLGYVGEWHTHPRGRAAMSEVDEEAVRQIKQTLGSVGIPAHIMILSPNETKSFVFSTD